MSGVSEPGRMLVNSPPWLIPIPSGPVPVQQPFQADAGLSRQRAQVIVGGDRLCHPRHQPELQMVLKFLADARQIVHDFDAVAAQQVGWADAGELQQLRTLQRARRQHDLAGGAHLLGGAVLAIAQAFTALRPSRMRPVAWASVSTRRFLLARAPA